MVIKIPGNSSTAVVQFQRHTVAVQERESVLEALLRAGHTIPNSCRAGLCQSCLLKSDESLLGQNDVILTEAQQGLSDEQVSTHHFLSCCCFPEETLYAELPDRDADWQAEVVGRQLLSPLVLELSLKTDGRWSPGQHILLWKDKEFARSYSIVSHPRRDGVIILHIRRHTQGVVSRWCHDELAVGDQVRLSPPTGHCVYDIEDSDKPLLLVATGTGLAPVFGVLQEAVAQNHQGQIDLFFGGKRQEELYLLKELRALEAQESRLKVHIVPQDASPTENLAPSKTYTFEKLINAVRHAQKSLRGTKVYLCGAKAAIEPLQKLCFFAGASRNDIVAEEFVLGIGADEDVC